MAALLSVALAPREAAAQDKINWKVVTIHRIGANWNVKWKWIQDELPKRTNGRIALSITTLPELGLSGFELLRVLKANLVDMADVTTAYVSGDFPLIEGANLPGIATSSDQVRQAYDAWTPKAIAPREDLMGGKVISHWNINGQYLVTKFPVNSLDDLKGKKIRVYAKSQADFLSALGAQPVNMAFAEVYAALERGTVEGAVSGPDAIPGIRLYEVAKYVTDLQLGGSPGHLIISRKSWDALPADLKKVIEDMQADLTKVGWDAGKVNDKDGLEVAVKQGMTVTVPAKPEWKDGLAKAGREAVKQWASRVGQKGVSDFNEVLAKVVGFRID
jgi:TRAP-type C4-dicarboxylate transport system substrate-binding protein